MKKIVFAGLLFVFFSSQPGFAGRTITEPYRPPVDPVPQILPAVTVSGFSCPLYEQHGFKHFLIGIFPNDKVEVHIHGIESTYGRPFWETSFLKTTTLGEFQFRADQVQNESAAHADNALDLTLKTSWGQWMKSFFVTQNQWSGTLRANGKTFSLDCEPTEIRIVHDSLWFTDAFDPLRP